MSQIPNAFGGFAPFPNTIMIPTMGLQSDVIGFRFGFGYEKGKRTLRAMSNEQFNTLNEEAEQAIYKEHDTTAINFFKLELQNWTNLQLTIIEKSVEIEVMKANRTPSAFREMFEGFTSGFTTQQTEDASKFFAQQSDPLLKLMAWFARGVQQIFSPSSETTTTTTGDTTGSTSPGDTSPHTTTTTVTNHISAHNDILTKYDETRQLELLLIGYATELEWRSKTESSRTQHRLAIDNLNNKITAGKARLVQLLNIITALQKNHQVNYGHQVIPYSTRL